MHRTFAHLNIVLLIMYHVYSRDVNETRETRQFCYVKASFQLTLTHESRVSRDSKKFLGIEKCFSRRREYTTVQ